MSTGRSPLVMASACRTSSQDGPVGIVSCPKTRGPLIAAASPAGHQPRALRVAEKGPQEARTVMHRDAAVGTAS